MGNTNLFKLSLERLQPSDWAHFEGLCAAFLVPEYPRLRTMAHPSGDGGRDSELFSPEGQTNIAFQYSIQKDWKGKIIKTVARLSEEFPSVHYLIFLSNQQIGSQADGLKKELLTKGLFLDIRDKNWFLERMDVGEGRQDAAEQLIDRIGRPYLVSEQVIEKSTSPLTSQEARAALLYLGMQWQDDIIEKGLTKLSFDALVRAALRNTNSDNRMKRAQVQETIHQYLPTANAEELNEYINAALVRLSKRYIRHWQKEDEFCLMHDEYQRILSRLAEKKNEENDFDCELTKQCSLCLQDIKGTTEEDTSDLRLRTHRVIEKLLLRKGEIFVSAIRTGAPERMGFDQVMDIIMKDIESHRPGKIIAHLIPKIVETIIRNILIELKDSTQRYIKSLADSYTLFTFLKETPDVQKATKKLFLHGTIWIDTTVLLPLFAEQLESDHKLRIYSRLISTCNEAGIDLCVTLGTIQEINAHMNKALTCSKFTPSYSWKGRVPYLFYQYLKLGGSDLSFDKWLSLFRGNEHPDEDIAQYLLEEHGIEKVSLIEESITVDKDFRQAADRLWTEAHYERRGKNAEEADENTTIQLIKNDLETYLGVIALRSKERVTELGYKHWLLTLDSIAWQIRNRLRKEFEAKTPSSPLLSVDFLLNNLAFGPERHRLTREEEQQLPMILDIEMTESVPEDILKVAEDVRKENEGLPDYVIRRKVRDAINKSKMRRACDQVS